MNRYLRFGGVSWLCLALLSLNCDRVATFKLSLGFDRFDAGGSRSSLSAGAIQLTPDARFDTANGYGWTLAPSEVFERTDLERSRTDFTIDGVVASELAFRADLPAGKWWVTLWVEAGMEDSSTVVLKLNKKEVPLLWHPFEPPAEPRKTLQKAYRVFHGVSVVDQDGLSISLQGGADSVRLLGFTLAPDPVPKTPEQEVLLQHIARLGKYGVTESLGEILGTLEELRSKDSERNFVSYWHEQLSLLHEAETHFELRGWEWARRESGLGIFDRFHQAVMILDGLLNQPDLESYPLYERALWLRGRLLYWLGRERGGPNEHAGGSRDFTVLKSRYPDDQLIAMYTGETVDLPDACDELDQTPGAPAWSVIQRELLCRLRQIAHWWVTEQQAENGEFGGKLGDDVELLRWWTSLVLSGDTVALTGWKKLADGVWVDPKVHKGYATWPSDVEHSSEFISDTAPAMAMYSEDLKYVERLKYSADYFENLWTGTSVHGQRFFRSAWFSSSEVETEPPKNRDVEYNCRATKAVRYYAWKTEDRGTIAALREWSRAWASAAMRTDKGKPAGIIPASVRFPDEAINGDEPNWYEANMYWDYFDWDHHAGSMMLDQLLFTYTLTDDETLLQPLLAALELVRVSEGSVTGNGQGEPGSHNWVVNILRSKPGFWSVVAQWRLLMGDSRYDDLIMQYGTSYVRYRLSGNEKHLVEGLERTLEAVRYNTPLLTSEAVHTDRVYAPGSEHLKAMLTGDGIPESTSPYYAVSWEGTDETFTALVTDSGQDRLTVRIFSHNDKDLPVTLRIWQLTEGNYKLSYQTSDLTEHEEVDIHERGQRLTITLPSKKLMTVRLEAAQ